MAKKERTNKSVWLIAKYKDEFLLLKRSKTSNNPNLWNFPGGGVDKGESPIDSLVREAREEAGLRLKATDLKFLKTFPLGKKRHAFYQVEFKTRPKVKIDFESAKFKWVDLEDFPRGSKLHKPTRLFFKKVLRAVD